MSKETGKCNNNSNIKYFSEKISKKFLSATEHFEEYLTPNNYYGEKHKENIKSMYDFLKSDKKLVQGYGLPELIIDNFGPEEIWSQLELENQSLYFRFITDVSKTVTSLKNIKKKDESSKDDELSNNENVFEKELRIEKNSNEDHESEDQQKNDKLSQNSGSEDQSTSSVISQELKNSESEKDENFENASFENSAQEVGDKFFNLKEMENFLNNEDLKEIGDKNNPEDNGAENDDEDNESIDYFAESDDEDTADDIRYKNFFAAPGEELIKTKSDQSHGIEEESDSNFSNIDDSDIESDDGIKMEKPSTLELREERLKKKIGHLENAALAEKSWQLKGEISADIRPQNSLLEEVLDFDLTARPNLIVTAQTNLQLEDIIKQRIKDKAWDSVRRKAKLVDEPLEYKKKLALDSEKSKESLAQIYEKDYIKQRESIIDPENFYQAEESTKETETTAKINNLFHQLDALNHFYFTPRLVKPEAKIISNLPAITMEEVAPISVSNIALLAPEEVRPKQKGVPMSKEERTTTDKKRERRMKKTKQRKRRLEEETKAPDEPKNKKQAKFANKQLIKQVTKDRNISLMKSSSDNIGKSSEKFFDQLQDQIKNQISTKIKSNNKKKEQNKFCAKKFKL